MKNMVCVTGDFLLPSLPCDHDCSCVSTVSFAEEEEDVDDEEDEEEHFSAAKLGFGSEFYNQFRFLVSFVICLRTSHA